MIAKWFKQRKKSEAIDKDVAAELDARTSEAKPKSSSRKRSSQKKSSRKPSRPSWSPADYQVPEQEGKLRFHDLNLDDRLLHGIADLGFEYCSPIQAATLPDCLNGHDAVGKAQTGTGKTAAFLITLISDLLARPVEGERYVGEPRALVIAPTRELVVQIGEDARGLAKYCDLGIVTLIGGVDFEKQRKQLSKGLVDLVVATPGRLLDFAQRGDLHLDLVEVLVIDEADRMLDMGFIPQVRRIVRSTPSKDHRQTLLFSATFTPEVLELTERWTHDPIKVEIEPERVATANIDQFVYLVAEDDKYRVLRQIIAREETINVIVFANRRDQTRKIFERLRKDGVSCGLLSGEIAQQKRTRTLEQFRSGKIQVLVATDVAGRGIHVDGISHVINYTLPEDPDDYVHRIGRTGRAGAKGTSISFASEDDAFLLPDIEALLGEKLECIQPPLS